MATNDHHNRWDGFARWLLGALGLLWLAGIAVRALGRESLSVARPTEPAAGTAQASRFGDAQPLPAPTRGHETRDANAKWIFGIVLFLLVFGLAIHGILAWFLSALKHSKTTTDAWEPIPEVASKVVPAQPPYPVLQVSPPMDLQRFRAREDAELQSYGWINRTSGIVRIPIAQAMELVLQEGLPARSGTNQVRTGPSTYQLMQRRAEHREPEIQGQK